MLLENGSGDRELIKRPTSTMNMANEADYPAQILNIILVSFHFISFI